MPAKFSDDEKIQLREALVKTAKEAFVRFGLKKTSVEDLTTAVGIGQGTFYRFFDSKEELFFEILEREELMIADQINAMLSDCDLTKTTLKSVLIRSLTLMNENEMMSIVTAQGEYGRLLRRIPQGKLTSHLARERQCIQDKVEILQKRGVVRPVRPEVITGMLYGLSALYQHRKEIGINVFDEAVELLVDSVCDALGMRGDGNLPTDRSSIEG